MSAPGYDVLVLGGGTAGCVLAGRLSEDPGRRVCLVEAGPDYGSFRGGGWPEEIVDARWRPFTHAWSTDREDRSQWRARILGGCSTQYGCVLFEGAPEDYDEWGPGWTYAELAPFLARARDALRARTPEPDQLSPWHRAFLDAGGNDAVLLEVNALGRVRWNAAFAYVDPARDRPNLTILSDTLVDRVVVERGRARGAL
ncbi:MAG TPA: GMC family oxidoreductase N-terminal domain-containing protein, partial [Actinomycetota bacterium]|nr:GMC family oxidoreductase N-terminal domain-containing protein [Actinomycetota bacterium]